MIAQYRPTPDSSVWPAAGLLEREVIDHFGVLPEGNPQPYRLLLPDVLAVDTLPEDTTVPHAAATNADLSGVPSSSSFEGPGSQG